MEILEYYFLLCHFIELHNTEQKGISLNYRFVRHKMWRCLYKTSEKQIRNFLFFLLEI